MPEVTTNFKQPRVKQARGRARPNDPLALCCDFLGCQLRSTERHHILPRGPGSTDDRENTMDLCTGHHRFIHANPSWTYSMGYLKRRGT